jgi:hypothetical protein
MDSGATRRAAQNTTVSAGWRRAPADVTRPPGLELLVSDKHFDVDEPAGELEILQARANVVRPPSDGQSHGPSWPSLADCLDAVYQLTHRGASEGRPVCTARKS